jgi:hypothetical protein
MFFLGTIICLHLNFIFIFLQIVYISQRNVYHYNVSIKNTVKPVLTAIYEQRPPVNKTTSGQNPIQP